MTQLRRLRPLIIAKNRVRIDPGPPPQPILLKLSQLRINDDYQRQLSRDSSRLAAKIACEFDWELFHLPVVSPTGDCDEVTGLPLYEVLDGQHTSIAAVSNGHLTEIWCWPGRAGESLANKATSFEKLNTQQTAVTPVDLFWSRVTAGNEEALDVLEACRRTGASIVKRPKPYGDMKVGETICVQALTQIAKAGGRVYVERVLRVCMGLRLAPITKIWILAIEDLLFKPNSLNHLTGLPSVVDMQIENAVDKMGQEELLQKVKIINAGVKGGERRPEYWLLASFIKREILANDSR